MTAPRSFRQHRFAPPPGATELLLVRHGESEPAVEGSPFPLVDGHGDPALSPEGRDQATLVCARLAREGIGAIYVSKLRRTAETAAALAAALGTTPTVDPDLHEVHLGEWEGGAFRLHVAEGHPAALRMYEEERWDAIPGAESADAFAARARRAVERIAAAHPDQRVAVFAHGGIIGQILAEATRSRPFAFTGADNASVSHLVVVGQRWVLRRFNDTTHLDAGLTTEAAPPT
ncbi:MAG: histidine phosphatase family protein [Acidimicrobiales bacterium]